MSAPIDVTDAEDFRTALDILKASGTHGDTLAIYLALKKHQRDLPTVGDIRDGFTSGYLERLLDGFYSKRHKDLAKNSGKVCRIFGSSRGAPFSPQSSYKQNNWRDVFRYANGFSCLAPETDFTSDFLGQHRSQCKYLVKRFDGDYGCSLHYLQTKYIRGLDKPKFLKWTITGKARGDYKLLDLDDLALVEFIRPLCRGVHLESLIVALYFGATWNNRQSVTIEQFVSDFNFAGVDQVELLFSTELDDRALRPEINSAKAELLAKLMRPFALHVVHPKKKTTIKERNVRERAFAEAVREAYDYSCAVCGLKLQSIGGQFEAQAAHVVDRAKGGDDDIRNGVALCRTHHWYFDHNGFTIDSTYDLIWDSHLPSAGAAKVTRQGRMHLPQGTRTWPAHEALKWHRDKTLAVWAAAPNSAPRRKRQPPTIFP